MAGTTIHDLPEELLAEILSHFASQQHDVDLDTLKACALVHSTWRDPAHRIICEAGVELQTEADVVQWTRTRPLRRYAPNEMGLRAYKSRAALRKLLDGCEGLRWLMLATPTRTFDPAVLAHPALSGSCSRPFGVVNGALTSCILYRSTNHHSGGRDPPLVSRPCLPFPPPFTRRRRHGLSFPSPRVLPRHCCQDVLRVAQDPILIRLLFARAFSRRRFTPSLRILPDPPRPLALLLRLIRPVSSLPHILHLPRVLRMHLAPRPSPLAPAHDTRRPRDNRRRASNTSRSALRRVGEAQGHQAAVLCVLEGRVWEARGREQVGERDRRARGEMVVCRRCGLNWKRATMSVLVATTLSERWKVFLVRNCLVLHLAKLDPLCADFVKAMLVALVERVERVDEAGGAER